MADAPSDKKSSGAPLGQKRDTRFKKGHQSPFKWKKGQSGNPSGLPKGYADLRSLARAYTKEAVKGIIEMAQDETHPQRMAACKELLDRGHGKHVNVQLTGADGGPVRFDIKRLSDEQFAGLKAALSTGGRDVVEPDVGADSGGVGTPEPE